MAWGGKREGAGRPVGWRKENPRQRQPHTVAAFAEEWELINRFSKLVKYGDKDLSVKGENTRDFSSGMNRRNQ